MFPLRALLYRRTFPAVTLLIIGINLFCFLIQISEPSYMQRSFLAHYALIPDRIQLTALVTSMFLHGGWFHLIGNMWFLWVFGSYVEDALGPAKFLVFYLLCGVASAIVHLITNLGSPIPTLGASGAIAGVMGAFLLLYPKARILTVIFIIIFFTTVEIPAAFLLIYWFAIQLLSGLSSFGGYRDAGGVAWFAHVGGFLAGILLLRMFSGRPPRYSY
jgi:rhomboid family protein